MHRSPETRFASLLSARFGLTLAVAVSILLTASIALSPAAHASSSYTAAASGDWASPGTWGGTAPPPAIGSSDFVTIPAGTTVTIGGGTSVSLDGGFLIVRGTLDVAGSLGADSGNLVLTGTLSVSGSSTLSPAAYFDDYGGSIDVLGGGAFSNDGGQLSLQVNTSPCCAYATITVAGGGSFNNAGYVEVVGGGDNYNKITNEGTFNNEAGGTVDVPGGHFYNYLNFDNAPGATFLANDDLQNYGSFVNAGSFQVNGGVESTGSFTNSGSFGLYGTTSTFFSPGPFTNTGTGTVTVFTTLTVGPAPALNQNGGTISVDGGTLTLSNSGGVGTLTNEGSIVVGPSPGSTFDNFGVLYNHADGTLNVGTDGTYVGGVLYNQGQVSNQGSFASGGVENYASITNDYGGRLTVSSPLDYFFNNIGATLTNNQGGTVSIGLADGLNNEGTIDNRGLIMSTGPGSIASDSSYFYNFCPTGSVTAAISDNLLPTNEGCALTFQQYTLPSGQEWGVTVYTLEAATNGATGQLVWVTAGSAHFSGTGNSITAPSLSGQAFSYSVDSPLAYGPDISFNCENAVPLPFSGAYYTCSGTGGSPLTGTTTLQVNFGESYHIPTTASISPGSASTSASDPNGVVFTVTVADGNNGVTLAPNGYLSLSDGGAGGSFGDGYADGPGSYSPGCLYETDSYTSQCQFTYYPNPVGSSTTTVTITADFGGDYAHLGSSAAAAVTVSYTYSVTFAQTGVTDPAATWGVTVDSVHYTGTGPSITVPGLSGTATYSYDSPVPGYLCGSGCTGSVEGGGTVSATYLTPAQAVQQLVGGVNGMNLPQGIANSLDAKLNAASSSLGHGNTQAAINQLDAFINEVNAQAGKAITAAQAQQLVTDAQAIVSAVSS